MGRGAQLGRTTLRGVVHMDIHASSRTGLRNPVSDRRFEHGEVDVAKRAELDAVSRHTRLAEFSAVGLSQVCLVTQPRDVDGDAGRVGAQADLIELAGSPIGVAYGQESICSERSAGSAHGSRPLIGVAPVPHRDHTVLLVLGV